MADSKTPYSTVSNYYVTTTVPSSSVDQGRYDRSKERERKYNDNWNKQKVNINEIVDKFAPGSTGRVEGVKFIFQGPNYTVKADMASGYLRIMDNSSEKYLKLDGTPGNREETHFKIKKREEM